MSRTISFIFAHFQDITVSYAFVALRFYLLSTNCTLIRQMLLKIAPNVTKILHDIQEYTKLVPAVPLLPVSGIQDIQDIQTILAGLNIYIYIPVHTYIHTYIHNNNSIYI